MFCLKVAHSQCLDDWLVQQPTCPFCRQCLLETSITDWLAEGDN